MSVEGSVVIDVKVQHGDMQIHWHDEAWEQWTELHADESVRVLVSSARAKLSAGKERLSTGKGKA